MAQIEESGDRESTVELNLVPFIDLMSVCIIFLLITAVWTQVSMIQIGSSIHAPQNPDNAPTPPDPKKEDIKINVNKAGYTVTVGSRVVSIPKKAGDWDDDGLIQYMKQIKEKYSKQDKAMIALLDDLTYENLIRGMDSIMQGGFPEISISTGER
ncbi:MAG: biopolymer transporter ExbD [Bdellovibrionia bacterium]